MTPEQFWHDEPELLEAYQIAYMRNKSYNAWLQGQYAYMAHSIVISNAFAKKGATMQKYPEWQDPAKDYYQRVTQRKPISENERERLFRQEQQSQNEWLRNLKKQ